MPRFVGGILIVAIKEIYKIEGMGPKDRLMEY